MRRLIIFLVRKRLGLKRYEHFRFSNQKGKATYYFTSTNVMKMEYYYVRPSSVSLNWLLDDECKRSIIKVKKGEL